MTTARKAFPKITRPTTGIGSLPHHNADAALEWAFRLGIPFLPQIPIRNPWEFMIPQALEGLPGLQLADGGAAQLNADIWLSRTDALARKLTDAFSRAPKEASAFEAFEPSPSVSSAWQPFVWELSERDAKVAKIQIAGPLTSQWSLTIKDSARELHNLAREDSRIRPDLSIQVFQLTLARALAMTRRLQADGIQPILYLDEPGLYGLSRENLQHVLGLQELKLMIQTLRKEGVIVGLHCCSNTDWPKILELGLDLLSIDTDLSLRALLAARTPEGGSAFTRFLRKHGRLSLGVIPTARSSVLQSMTVEGLFAEVLDAFGPLSQEDPELVRETLAGAIFTPACGLALHSVSDAELILEILGEFQRYAEKALRLPGGARNAR